VARVTDACDAIGISVATVGERSDVAACASAADGVDVLACANVTRTVNLRAICVGETAARLLFVVHDASVGVARIHRARVVVIDVLRHIVALAFAASGN
jgi:hypothetical protein